jgi:hypothetical protein
MNIDNYLKEKLQSIVNNSKKINNNNQITNELFDILSSGDVESINNMLGGGVAPTKQQTPTPAPPTTPTKQQTPTPTPPPTKQQTPAPTPTPTKQQTPTPTPPPTKQQTPTPTPTPTKQQTPTPTKQQGPVIPVTPSSPATQLSQTQTTPTKQQTPTPTPITPTQPIQTVQPNAPVKPLAPVSGSISPSSSNVSTPSGVLSKSPSSSNVSTPSSSIPSGQSTPVAGNNTNAKAQIVVDNVIKNSDEINDKINNLKVKIADVITSAGNITTLKTEQLNANLSKVLGFNKTDILTGLQTELTPQSSTFNIPEYESHVNEIKNTIAEINSIINKK